MLGLASPTARELQSFLNHTRLPRRIAKSVRVYVPLVRAEASGGRCMAAAEATEVANECGEVEESPYGNYQDERPQVSSLDSQSEPP